MGDVDYMISELRGTGRGSGGTGKWRTHCGTRVLPRRWAHTWAVVIALVVFYGMSIALWCNRSIKRKEWRDSLTRVNLN